MFLEENFNLIKIGFNNLQNATAVGIMSIDYHERSGKIIFLSEIYQEINTFISGNKLNL